MFRLIAKIIAVEGQREKLISILSEPTQPMSGCISYIVAKDAQDKNIIWITEAWDTQESHDASLNLPSVRDTIQRAKPMIAGFENHILESSRMPIHDADKKPILPILPSAPSDFDFIIGNWHVNHRRLNSRLNNCTEWTQFSGLSSTHKVLGGLGNVEDNILHFPEGDVRATALRSFNTQDRTWAIWWLDQRQPHHLDVPVIGGFSQGVGTFYADDMLGDIPIKVRFIWNTSSIHHPTWEQAFSADNGITWETNWTMQFTRALN